MKTDFTWYKHPTTIHSIRSRSICFNNVGNDQAKASRRKMVGSYRQPERFLNVSIHTYNIIFFIHSLPLNQEQRMTL